ncbi:MAG: PAS domain-containing sensor histidine kinase [Hyphomicrobiales bacterium]
MPCAAEILAMQTDIDRAEPYFTFDHSQFEDYFATQTKIRNLVIAVLMKADGTEVMQAKPVESEPTVLPPKEVAADANADEPVLVTPGTTNQVGAVIKLKAFDDLYLYIGRLIDPRVTQYLRITEANAAEYKTLEARRYGVQVAFGLLYVGIALVMLLAAIWLGIGFANRLVAPIRRLIGAADQVSRGNLYVQVPLAAEEGDLANLSETFNNMTSQLRHQRDDLLSANEQLDQRSRFTEAVLAGVTAGVIGVDHRGCTTLANRSALKMLETDERTMLGKPVVDVMPEIADILGSAFGDPNRMHVAHEVVQREGGERNIMVRVTSEESDTEDHDFVITLDDITDLVTAQRTSAWADVARRIAHEIKNPLTPIQLSAERLKRKYGKVLTTDRDVFEQCTDTIIRQVGDIGRMVDEFSSFARMPKPVMEVGDLSETVRQTVFLMRVGHPDLTIEADLPEDPMRCRFDRRLIAQALTNIIKNATEGIAAAAGEEEPVGGRIRVVGRGTATHYEVDVIDNGIGLPKDNRRRLLEPYMTTREKGTGLGLAIVRKIVEDHGGTIELLDSPEVETGGRGAMVRLTVARIETPEEAGADGAAASETNGRPERQPNGV